MKKGKYNLTQIDNFDCLINKTMIKHKLYVIITPYIFVSIYCQSLLYQQMGSATKQEWNGTRLKIIKNVKKQVCDWRVSNPSSRIAISSIYNTTSEKYACIKSIQIGL